MNKVILMGRLTRDPEVRYSQGENALAIARYTLAVDRRGARRDGEATADFINCVAFGRSAEFAEKVICRGKMGFIAADGGFQRRFFFLQFPDIFHTRLSAGTIRKTVISVIAHDHQSSFQHLCSLAAPFIAPETGGGNFVFAPAGVDIGGDPGRVKRI